MTPIGSSLEQENESDVVCVPKAIERKRRNLSSPVSEPQAFIYYLDC